MDAPCPVFTVRFRPEIASSVMQALLLMHLSWRYALQRQGNETIEIWDGGQGRVRKTFSELAIK
jgi:hypothetical protein